MRKKRPTASNSDAVFIERKIEMNDKTLSGIRCGVR